GASPPRTRTGCRPRSPTSPISTRTAASSRATIVAGSSASAIGSGTPTAPSRWSPPCTRSAMRAAYDALDEETRIEIEDLVCEHSQLYSRQQVGFTDFTDEERRRFAPV